MTLLENKDEQTMGGPSKNLEKKIQRKQKRFQHMIANDANIVCCDQPTRYLVVCNAGLSTGLDQTTLVSEFTKYGDIIDVCLIRDKSYCFVVCADEANAIKIYEGTHAKSRLGQHDTVIYLTYSTQVPTKSCNDLSQQNLPSGLVIIENFITPIEEEVLTNLFEWNPMEEQGHSILKHRQVKHFGYEFRYDTNNVDVEQPLINDKVPEPCNFLWDKFRDGKINDVLNEPPHQITVNKYEPGQGIPPHVDTHSAFKDAIVSLSLASDIVMEFRKPSITNAKEYSAHVSILLPRRSLLIMSGESRYGWKHGITPRKIDVIRDSDGHLTTKFRSKRISYTFRWLSKQSECKCEFHSLCDTYQKQESKVNSPGGTIENPSLCELENVHKVYNEIANHFSETRHSPWPQVNEFIQQFEIGSILVDIGCGNGKYLQSNREIFEIGCDRSDGLLNVCRERQFNIFQCDCLAVPIRSNSVDGCISIAVIHHLASEERRLHAIEEMIRILRPKGRGLIYVWAKNQALKTKSSYLRQNKRNNRKTDNDDDANENCDEENCDEEKTVAKNTNENIGQNSNSPLPIHTNRTQFEYTDILVPWKLKNPTKMTNKEEDNSCDQHPMTFLRFYHVFEENELEILCKRFENISIEKSYYDQGNWCVIFQKTSTN